MIKTATEAIKIIKDEEEKNQLSPLERREMIKKLIWECPAMTNDEHELLADAIMRTRGLF